MFEQQLSLNSLNSALHIAGATNVVAEKRTTEFTVSVLKSSITKELNIDTDFSRVGHYVLKIDDTKAGSDTIRELAGAVVAPTVQAQVAERMINYDQVARAIAPVLGVKNNASMRLNIHTVAVTRAHCQKMAANLTKSISYDNETRLKDEKGARLLATALFMALFDDVGLFLNGRSMQLFLEPLVMSDIYTDPYSGAIAIEMIESSPFKEFFNDASQKKKLLDGGQWMSFTRLVTYFNTRCKNFLRDFKLNAEKVEQAMIGLQVMADGAHRRVDLPASWVEDSLFAKLRTDIVFHNLTLGLHGNTNIWNGASMKRIADLRTALKAIAAPTEGDGAVTDDIRRQAAIDMEHAAQVKPFLRVAQTLLEKYIDFLPAREFTKLFSVSSVSNHQDRDFVNFVQMTFDHKRAEELDIFTGYSLSEDQNVTGEMDTSVTASLTTHAGTFHMPSLSVMTAIHNISDIMVNLGKSEIMGLFEHIKEDALDFGGVVSMVPGSAVALLTNANDLDISSDLDFMNTENKNGESTIPFLVYACAAGFASEVIFAPGQRVRFIRRAEPGQALRECEKQLTERSTLTRDILETENPLDILIATELGSIKASKVFEVEKSVVNLKELVDREFILDSSMIKEFTLPQVPTKAKDRKAALGRGGDQVGFPFMEYTSRFVRVNENGEDGEMVNPVVRAPIDLRPHFANHRKLYVGIPKCYVTIDSEINTILDAIKDLGMIAHFGELHAQRLLGNLIKVLMTPYAKTGVHSRDIVNMSVSPSAHEIREFMVYSGLYGMRQMSELTSLIDVKTIDRVIDSVNDLSDEEYVRVAEAIVAITARRVEA